MANYIKINKIVIWQFAITKYRQRRSEREWENLILTGFEGSKNQEEVPGGIVLALADDELGELGDVVVGGVAEEEVEEVLDRALFLLLLVAATSAAATELLLLLLLLVGVEDDDAVQRLLLYVDLLGGRAQLVHAFPGLVRNVVEGLFRLGEDLVCARGRGGGQFFYLRV